LILKVEDSHLPRPALWPWRLSIPYPVELWHSELSVVGAIIVYL